MSDIPRRDIPEAWGEASKDALSSLIRELGVSPEVEKMIRALQWNQKELCIISLEDILVDTKEKNIWNADRDKKIQETLAGEYGITYRTESEQSFLWNEQEWRDKEALAWKNEYAKLNERLEKVKSLDTTIVDEELAKAKASTPLPEDIKGNIAKNTGIPPEQLDAVIASGSNPQVTNLVDTFYLTHPDTESAIKKQLSEKNPTEKAKADANMAFSELRASARDLGVLAPFRSKDIGQYIADKPDKTQKMVLDASKAITGGRGDIPVERRGETLIFKSLDGKEVTHTIDMEKRPPQVTKIRGVIQVTQDVPDTAEQEKQAKIKWDLESARSFTANKEKNITDLYKSVRPNLSAINQQELSLPMIDEYMTILRSKEVDTDKKREACEKLIPLYEKAAYSDTFRPQTRMEWEDIKITEGLTDYFSGEMANITELQKKYTEQSRLEKIYNPNQKRETSSEDFEENTRQNLDGLARLWITQFRSMDEVYAFLMSQNGPEIGNRWLTPEDINSSLGKEKIVPQQWDKILKNLGILHDKITGADVSNLDNDAKIKVLTRPEWNGVPRIINSLRSFKIEKNGGSDLSRDDFMALLNMTRLQESQKP